MSAVPVFKYVCGILVTYTDGTHDLRVVHRGTEQECRRISELLPMAQMNIDKDAPAGERVTYRNDGDGNGAEMVYLEGLPANKVREHAAVIVIREDRL